jgi:hypothetical protein
MGDQGSVVTKDTSPRKDNATPSVDQEGGTTQMKGGLKAPPFAVTASPIQKKDDPKPKKTPEEIAAKKAELEADDSVIKPGQVWEREDKKIADAAAKRFGVKRTAKLESITLCGKKVNNVNALVKPKIDKVNAAFDKETEAVRKEITDSLQVVGGYNYRVQSKANSMDNELKDYGLTGYKRTVISDHAFGCAFDVNANMGTKQNNHWKKDKKADRADKLLMFVETIIKKYDKTFDLATSKGVDQVTGINSFSGHLQTYANTLLRTVTTTAPAAATKDMPAKPTTAVAATPAAPTKDVPVAPAAPTKDVPVAPVVEGTKDAPVKDIDIFADSKESLRKLKECKTDTANCKVIIDNWETFKGWEKGTRHEKVGKKEVDSVIDDPKTFDRANKDTMDLKGVVDLNTNFVKFMIDAGFTWGGDFSPGNKDYMHFEDEGAMATMKTDEPKAKEAK